MNAVAICSPGQELDIPDLTPDRLRFSKIPCRVKGSSRKSIRFAFFTIRQLYAVLVPYKEWSADVGKESDFWIATQYQSPDYIIAKTLSKELAEQMFRKGYVVAIHEMQGPIDAGICTQELKARLEKIEGWKAYQPLNKMSDTLPNRFLGHPLGRWFLEYMGKGCCFRFIGVKAQLPANVFSNWDLVERPFVCGNDICCRHICLMLAIFNMTGVIPEIVESPVAVLP